MGRRALALTILLSVAAPGAAGAGAQRGAAPRLATRGAAAKPVRSHPRPARAPTLADARAAMTALMRDRSRRRYHHHFFFLIIRRPPRSTLLPDTTPFR